MMRIAFLCACLFSCSVIADELPRTEQLRVLIIETEQDISAQRVILDEHWSAVTRAANHEMDVYSRMPWSILELPGAMSATTEATVRWEEQLAIYDYLQNLRLGYEAELSGLLMF